MNILLKKMSQCNKDEIRLYSYYDVETREIVIIEDHPFLKKHLPFVLAHELGHYYLATTRWARFSFLEELYNLLWFQRKLLIKST